MAAHKVSVEFTGDVFSVYIELEGHEIKLANDGAGTWSRVFEEFEIDGALDVHCVAKGFAGVHCLLTVTIGSGTPTELKAVMPKKTALVIDTGIEVKSAVAAGKGK